MRIKIFICRTEGYGPIRVSRNLRFGLYNGLRIFPDSKTFIVLEDDLIVSPDFYELENRYYFF